MKLYIFSDDELSDVELDKLAELFVKTTRKERLKKPKAKPINDDDIISLALALDLSVEQIDDIMGL